MFFWLRRKKETEEGLQEEAWDPLEEALYCLEEVWKGSRVMEESVVKHREELSVTPRISQSQDGFASLYFEVNHPDFEEPFTDMSAGVGETEEDAIFQAVASFRDSSLEGILRCMRRKFDYRLTSVFLGQEIVWDVSESSVVSLGSRARTEGESYWEKIRELLPGHLGGRRRVWVKVYASRLDNGDVTCECRVNGVVSRELTRALEACAAQWDVSRFSSDKQFFFLVRRGGDLKPYPFSRQQVWEYTDLALPLVAGGRNGWRDEELMDALCNITGDRDLAVELASFLPEICAQKAFPEPAYSERAVIVQGELHTQVYLDQLASYRWMEQRVSDGLAQGQFKIEDYGRLTYSSAVCSALNRALGAGSKLENLALDSLLFAMPVDYRIR